jgi:hypothetical protein
MRVIIAGPRDYYNYDTVVAAVIASGFQITEVVSGKARGVDTLGEDWANANGIPIKPFPADWDKYPKNAAGPIRNEQMACYAEALIAIWDGHTSGTGDMIKRAKKHKLKLYIHWV